MTIKWITIPTGRVTLEAGGYLTAPTTFDVPAFAITQTPITNAQFAPFVEAGGYHEQQWWDVDGWALREKQGWTEPRFWDAPDWNRPNYPVVGLSWYETRAFCCWMRATVDGIITLPTEQQWQRAAQGDDGREFPWGADEPNELVCNWQRERDGLSPVRAYPDGVSPTGAWDMSGNVWEWTLTGWESGTDPVNGEARILRGGSWSSDSPISLRAGNRNPHDPNARLIPADRNQVTVGFRCVRTT